MSTPKSRSRRKSSSIFSSAKRPNQEASTEPRSQPKVKPPPQSHILRLDHLSCGFDPQDLSMEDIFNPTIPFFMRKSAACKCISTLVPCSQLSSLVNPRKLTEMETEYQLLLAEAERKSSKQLTGSCSRFSDGQSVLLPSIFLPHMANLKKLIKLDSASELAITSILNHAKSDDLAFWIYCEMVAHMPGRDALWRQLKGLLERRSRTLKQSFKSMTELEQFVAEIHRSKAANLIPVEHYARFVAILITTTKKHIVSRIIFCYLIYMKEKIRKEVGRQIAVIMDYRRSPEVDWQTILSAVDALKDET